MSSRVVFFVFSAILAIPAESEINRLHLGAHLTPENVVFRVYSSRATRIEVNLYRQGANSDEVAHLPLTQDAATAVWSVTIPLDTIRTQLAIAGSIYYGYRAWGPNWPFDPAWTKGSAAGFLQDVDASGNRFNPNKLLLDPYAREISQDPVTPDNPDGSIFASGPDHRLRDTGSVAPKGIVIEDLPASDSTRPHSLLKDDIIYEVHLRGLTKSDSAIPAAARGTYRGAAMEAARLKSLGVTAVEFLPLQETQNDNNDTDPGSANYWGYATLNYFAPDRRYASDRSSGGPTRELQQMVSVYHNAGLKVFVDVVYNHTGEGYAYHSGDASTFNIISWRGLDNPTYYLLTSDHQFSYDNTGVGGNYNVANTVAQDLIVDSLAYWHDVLGVDGFRFDLASVLGNTCTEGCFHFDKLASGTALNRLAREFPGVPLIAEPWAIGDGTYQLGGFPAGWSEWNGAFRDKIRQSQNKLGVESFTTGELAMRFSGSADLFQNNGRNPWNSINFMVSHDGFTLADLYRFNFKNNNQKFPAGPSDGGSDNNESWDQGGDPADQIKAARTGFALLMLSAGTPMMTGGDEFLRSLNGNNNAYNLDTSFNWLNYSLTNDQKAFQAFAQTMIALRSAHPELRPDNFFSADQLLWFRPDGGAADAGYFNNPDNHAISWTIGGALFLAYNAWSQPVSFSLPPGSWTRVVDTSTAVTQQTAITGPYTLPARSVLVLTKM
jgi:isoamylase